VRVRRLLQLVNAGLLGLFCQAESPEGWTN
jgi:hypothetical protein